MCVFFYIRIDDITSELSSLQIAKVEEKEKAMTKEETIEENKAITSVMLEMMKYYNLHPIEFSATANLYVIFPGATCEVASVLGGQDCKWFGITYGKTTSSIRVCSSQDYSILLHQLELQMMEMDKKISEEDEKDYKSCLAYCEFIKNHLRPSMVQHGLVGRRSYWNSGMKSLEVVHRDEPDSSTTKWFDHHQSVWIVPQAVKQPDALYQILPPRVSNDDGSYTMKYIKNNLSVITSSWSIQMGLTKHPEFASLDFN